MNKIKFLALSTFLIGILILPALVLAQGEQVEVKANETLEVKSVGLLPTSPLYFLKEASRGIQLFFTFNPEKKAELKLKITSEKLAEAKAVSEKQPENTKALEKALVNYEANRTELKARLEKLSETSKNPNIGTIIQKIDEKISAHTELFNSLIIKTGKEPEAYPFLNMHFGVLKASGPSIQMWGTHVLEVTTKKGDVRIDRVQAIDDEVLNQLRKYEGQKVIIRGMSKYYDIEGGFWGIVAEAVMAPEFSGDTSSSIKIISPKAFDKWQTGKTYQIKWIGGATSLWIYIPTDDGKIRTIAPIKTSNNGLYSWSIPNDFPIGKYSMEFWFSDGSSYVSSVEIISSDQSSAIKIISPNGGEKWEAGKTYSIKWSGAAMEALYVWKTKQKVGAPVFTIVHHPGVSDSSGVYHWTIPRDNSYLIPGEYIAQITGCCSTQRPDVPSDNSDAPFTISAYNSPFLTDSQPVSSDKITIISGVLVDGKVDDIVLKTDDKKIAEKIEQLNHTQRVSASGYFASEDQRVFLVKNIQDYLSSILDIVNVLGLKNQYEKEESINVTFTAKEKADNSPATPEEGFKVVGSIPYSEGKIPTVNGIYNESSQSWSITNLEIPADLIKTGFPFRITLICEFNPQSQCAKKYPLTYTLGKIEKDYKINVPPPFPPDTPRG